MCNGGHFEDIVFLFTEFSVLNKKKQFFNSNGIGVISISLLSLPIGHFLQCAISAPIRETVLTRIYANLYSVTEWKRTGNSTIVFLSQFACHEYQIYHYGNKYFQG